MIFADACQAVRVQQPESIGWGLNQEKSAAISRSVRANPKRVEKSMAYN